MAELKLLVEPFEDERPWWARVVAGLVGLLVPVAFVLAFLGGWVLIPLGIGVYWAGRKALEGARRATLRGVGEWIVALVAAAIALVAVAIVILVVGSGINFLSGR